MPENERPSAAWVAYIKKLPLGEKKGAKVNTIDGEIGRLISRDDDNQTIVIQLYERVTASHRTIRVHGAYIRGTTEALDRVFLNVTTEFLKAAVKGRRKVLGIGKERTHVQPSEPL